MGGGEGDAEMGECGVCVQLDNHSPSYHQHLHLPLVLPR